MTSIILLILTLLTPTPDAYMTIRFGWSLGPMDGIEIYGANLFPGETKKGRGNYRVFVSAGKDIDTNVAYTVNKVKYIIDRSYNSTGIYPNIMLVLRGFPYSDMEGRNLSVLTTKQREVSMYMNGFVPSNIAAYERYLTRLMEALKTAGYLPRISVELWGEPNAASWFWGYNAEANTFPAFYQFTSIKYNIVKNYPIRIYHGDYTSSLQRDSAYKENRNYWGYVNNDSFYTGNICRSHSFYWNDSGGEFDTSNNDWIDRPGEVCISEYNLFVKVNKGSVKDSIFNSNEWGFKLYQFLKFIYAKKQENKGTVTEIYVHSLCNYSNKYDDKGSLGLWGKYQTPEHHVYYLPKKSWTAMNDIHTVIKDGFYPIAGGLQGRKQKILFKEDKSYIISN